jgi:hypothetical protein
MHNNLSLSSQEARLIVIALKGRASRLRAKKKTCHILAKAAVQAEIRDTENMHDKIIAHYPDCLTETQDA